MFRMYDADVAAAVNSQTAATLFHHLYHWVQKNEANGQNFFDGRYWTYNSIAAFKSIFSEMSEKTIRSSLEKLEKCGLVLTGEYNEKPFDHTKWYSITEKGKSFYTKGQIDLSQKADRIAPDGKPIPDSKPDIYNTPYNPPRRKPGNDDPSDVIAEYNFAPEVLATVEDWIAYKQERKEPYRPRGLKSLLSKIKSSVEKHGASSVIDIINEAMSSNYQGIVWDRLDRRPSAQQQRPVSAPRPKLQDGEVQEW